MTRSADPCKVIGVLVRAATVLEVGPPAIVHGGLLKVHDHALREALHDVRLAPAAFVHLVHASIRINEWRRVDDAGM